MSNLVSSIIIIGLVFLVAATSAFFLNSFRNSIDLVDTSSTQTILTSSTDTLSPVGNGITSSEVKANNLVGLEFATSDYALAGGGNITSPFAHDNITTLQIWFKLDKALSDGEGSDGRYYMLSKAASGEFEYELIITNETTKTMYFRVYNPTASASQTAFVSHSLTSYRLNEWENILIVMNGTNVKSYLNGYQGGSYFDLEELSIAGDSNLSIGKRYNSDSLNFSTESIIFYNQSFSNSQVTELIKNTSLGSDRIYIPVMMYHAVCPVGSAHHCVNETELNIQMQYFEDEGFSSITDIEYYNWTQNNGFIMPDKPIMFTWDDAHYSVLENASIIMASHGFKGVSAVTTGFVGTTDYMTWNNITDLIDIYNWSVASHSDKHCHMGSKTGGTAPTWCNTTATRQGNLSISKQYIIGNLSFTPITMIFPYNNWGTDGIEQVQVMADCRLNYTICFGTAFEYDNARFIWQGSNLSDGDLTRIAIFNYTTLNQIKEVTNFTLPELKTILKYDMNENSGTTAYDTSGLSNDGTITGATWFTDGLFVTLTSIVDYTINPTTGLFTIVNDDYSWSWMNATWSYDVYTTAGESNNEGILALVKLIEGIKFLISAVFFGAVIYIIINWGFIKNKINQ